MGSGKSTVIIPYLVYTNLIRDIKTIIQIPDNPQIKNEMINNITSVTMLFDKKCYLYDEHDEILFDEIDLMLLTYTEIKNIFLNTTNREFLQNYIIYIDEADMFLDPCTCEYNIKTDESPVDKKTIDILLNYIDDNNNNDKINKLISYDNKINNNNDKINNNNDKINIYNKIVHNLEFFKEFLKKLKYNKHYGIGHAGKIYNNIKMPLLPIAKPYKYVNVPLIDSDFSETYVKIYTTYYSYINYVSYTYEQIEYILFTIQPEYIRDKNRNKNMIKEIILSCVNNKKIKSDIIEIENINKLRHYMIYNDGIKKIQTNNFYKIVIVGDRNILLYIISYIQTNELKILNNINNVTNYDIFIGSTCIGFTGTP